MDIYFNPKVFILREIEKEGVMLPYIWLETDAPDDVADCYLIGPCNVLTALNVCEVHQYRDSKGWFNHHAPVRAL